MDIKPMSVQDATGVNAVNDLGALRRLATIEDPRARAEAVATQLEAVFFGMVVKSMRATVPEGGLLGKGLGGRTYIEMLDQQFSQLSAVPRDPRLHEALVRQIVQSPGAVGQEMEKLK